MWLALQSSFPLLLSSLSLSSDFFFHEMRELKGMASILLTRRMLSFSLAYSTPRPGHTAPRKAGHWAGDPSRASRDFLPGPAGALRPPLLPEG